MVIRSIYRFGRVLAEEVLKSGGQGLFAAARQFATGLSGFRGKDRRGRRRCTRLHRRPVRWIRLTQAFAQLGQVDVLGTTQLRQVAGAIEEVSRQSHADVSRRTSSGAAG